ncbi:unnamed protein product [Arctogadus glacialis]
MSRSLTAARGPAARSSWGHQAARPGQQQAGRGAPSCPAGQAQSRAPILGGNPRPTPLPSTSVSGRD